jgi:hypothetical protein
MIENGFLPGSARGAELEPRDHSDRRSPATEGRNPSMKKAEKLFEISAQAGA